MGFGVSGALASPLVSSADVKKLVHAAVDGGITFFDTGPSYGDGAAEERLGEAIYGINRNKVIISTKVGTFTGRLGRPYKDFSKKAILRSVDESLSRLNMRYVDLLLLHGPEAIMPETYDALYELKHAEKTRFVGVCGRAEELDAPIKTGQFDVVMLPFHMGTGRIERNRIIEASHRDMGIIGFETMMPLRILNPHHEISKPADLWYVARDMFKPKPRLPERQPYDFLERFAGWNPAELSLGYALSEAALSCSMITTTKLDHLQQCLRVPERDLPAGFTAQVEISRFTSI
jgi:aryl-alcohol dehydrogenase-like predicted oxidoreductase